LLTAISGVGSDCGVLPLLATIAAMN
jgi:hypothetical protein